MSDTKSGIELCNEEACNDIATEERNHLGKYVYYCKRHAEWYDKIMGSL